MYFTHADGQITQDRASGFLGVNTNNYAEHFAMEQALGRVWQGRTTLSTVQIFSDSLLVVNHVNQTWNIKPGVVFERLAFSSQTIMENLRELDFPITVQHFRREFNAEADTLVNLALDKEAARHIN